MKKIIIIVSISLVILLSIFMIVLNSVQTNKGFKVGISNGFIGNNWRNQMFEDLYIAIDLYQSQGLIDEVIIKNAGIDVDNQIEQIRHMMDQGVDLLLIDPNSSDALNDVINEAESKGILVVVFDQMVTTDKAVQLAINQKEWGRELAIWMMDELQGVGNIVIIEGVDNQSSNNERLEGMLEVIYEYPEIRILARANGNWDQASAKKVMTDIIATYPDIDGIITQDGMALGIIQAYESAESEILIMTGETMIAFMKKSYELSIEEGFRTFAITNPPGIGATALGLGLVLLQQGFENIEMKRYYYPVSSFEINAETVEMFELYRGLPGTHYIDDWMTIEEVEKAYNNW